MLGGCVGVERVGRAAKGFGIRIDPANSVPVVKKRQNEFDPLFFGGGDKVIKTWDACRFVSS